jgi:cell division protein FtsN
LRVGPYGSRVEAEKARDKLKAAGTAGIVVAK